MELYEFNQLNEAQQYVELFANGTHLLNCSEFVHTKVLYGLFGFYVEIAYLKSDNTITGITTFSSLETLEPFLEEINIEI